MKRGGEIIVRRRGRPLITEDTTQLIISSITSSASRIAYLNFINSLKSKETKRKYIYLFAKYLEYLNISYDGLATNLLKQDIRIIESDIILYMTRLKDEQGYSFASLNTSLAAITLFFTMNDIIINRNKIGKYLGEHIKTIKDRGYTHEKIRKMLDVSDLKFKPLSL